MRNAFLYVLVGWLLGGLFWIPPSAAQNAPAMPHLHLSPLEASRAALQSSAPGGPQAFAAARTVDRPLADWLAWEAQGRAVRIGRARVTSAGAETINLGFQDLMLPAGARLTVSHPDGTQARGPYAGAAARGTLFTPLIAGDTALITVVMPAGTSLQGRLTHVGHGWNPPERAFDPLRPQAAGACNIDTACAAASDWGPEAASVGRITYVRDDTQFSCSGALINTTAGPVAAHFLTAQHCIQAQREARTAVFYWNYEHPTCRPPGSRESGRSSPADPFAQTSTGATLRASIGTGAIAGGPDITLLSVDEPLSPDFNLFFSGWRRTDAAPEASATIHHPGGFAKRISFDDDPATVTGYGRETEGEATHLRIEGWDAGTTEPGSSGAPLFDTDQRITGVLSGGQAACGIDAPDWYGRLAAAWEGEDAGGRLRDWLDPEATGAPITDHAAQGALIDPPPPVAALSVTAKDVRSAQVAWQTPVYDAAAPVRRYRVRMDTQPIATRADFADATPVARPLARAPRSPETLQVPGLWPETPYYVAIQSENAAGWSRPTALPAPLTLPDRIAPRAVQDLQQAAPTPEAVTLTWTAPGDDGLRGAASAYDLRYAETPIETMDDFARAVPVPAVPVPDTAGTRERVSLSDVPRNTPLYFGLVAVDNAGNTSGLARTTRNVTLIDGAQQVQGPMPNPASGPSVLRVTVQTAQALRIRIYDTLGRAVGQPLERAVPALQAQRIALPVDALASGTYFVRVEGTGFAVTRRLVVVR